MTFTEFSFTFKDKQYSTYIDDDDNCINITKICKATNKQFSNWESKESSHQLLINFEKSQGWSSGKACEYRTSKDDKYSGIFIPLKIAAHVVNWIDTDMAIHLVNFIKQYYAEHLPDNLNIKDTEKHNIQIFLCQESSVRVSIIEKNPWFCCKDICKVLNIKNSRDISSKLRIEHKKMLIIQDSINRKHSVCFMSKQELLSLLNTTRSIYVNKLMEFLSDNFGVDNNILTRSLFKEQEFIENITRTFKHLEPKTQYSVGKYRADLYLSKINMVIECDEYGHVDRDAEYEKTREEFIKDALKCKIYRFNPDSKDFNIFDVIHDIIKQGIMP